MARNVDVIAITRSLSGSVAYRSNGRSSPKPTAMVL
uniref:Uncharacterized protein n=1 Tax=Ralstonia solanacearum TaxID=305 RepID=A0A0S4TXX8_RALSL|nr:protein of unknown function [Ralstonia solanacearum]